MKRLKTFRISNFSLLVTVCLCMCVKVGFAQNYYDHWAFGNGVHIDFTSGTPSVACNVSINSSEASAVWSNPVTGAFIAYTNGNIVYNGQNNNQLANGTGLTANASSIESALILPKPGESLDKFYIFHNNITNCYWSDADMSVGANGTVQSKNNFLQATGTERCGTVPHGTICPAYWLMISKSGNDSVAAYLIDSTGISSTPVVTATGISGGNARGNIVFSEDFSKIGMSVESKGMYVANFDNITGQTSNWVKVGNTTNGFGSAFSPDGTKLYYTSGFGQNVYQYNFTNSTQTYLGGSGLSYLALAPDGKIYISKYGQQSLAVISNPNAAGTACGYAVAGLSIPTGCQCRWGLPNPFHVDIGYHPPTPDTITLCPGEDTTYTTPVTGDSFMWNTGETTASIYLDSAGLYYCTIGFGDCSSSDTVYLQYVDEVAIDAETVCLDDTTFFTHSTAMPAASIIGYDWDFGDGQSSTSANPSHVYSTADTFTVTLEIETQSGCILDTFMEVIVHPNPIPEFTFENVCNGSSVAFLSQAEEGSAPIIAYEWDMTNNGNVNYSTISASHQYSNYGNYTVEYKVEDQLGCTDSMVKVAFVHPNPVADFYMNDECLHIEHAFNDNSQVALGDIDAWSWDFGDGASSIDEDPVHTYATAGTKTITLTVTTDSGCVDSKSLSTQVFHLPVADFQADSVCENVNAVFIQNGTSASGAITQYYWTFDDGTNSAVAAPTHNYNDPGLYTVKHYVTTQYGCKDSVEKNIRIYPAPNTSFGWLNNVCQGEELPFYDQSIIQNVTPGGDQIVSWEWILNNEPFSQLQNPVYQTSEYESFNVKLTTYSNHGCSTFASNIATIFPLPIASMVMDPDCQLYPSLFESTSTIPHGLVSVWNWDFGDGEMGVEEKPEHIYQLPGTYPISLHVESNKGCKDSTFGSIVVPETPKLEFNIEPEKGCSPHTAHVTNNSYMHAGTMSFKWYVNGKLESDVSSPSITLFNDTLAPVTYSLKLIATSELNCSAVLEDAKAITVLPIPKAKFTHSFDDFSIFDPGVTFENNSKHSVRWNWSFDDGTSSDKFAPEHYFERHGSYLVDLHVWNTYNCTDSMSELVVVDPFTFLYVPAAFTPNGDGKNETWGVQGENDGNSFSVRVFDRWGHLVYEADEMNFGWNGVLPDGRLAPAGVYAYHIVYRSTDFKPLEKTGQFTLVR